MSDSTNPSQPAEKKIIVDEDWKSQVEREKAEAQTQAQQSKPEQGVPQQGKPAASAEIPKSPGTGDVPLPPASLSYLATSLYYQAMFGLGLMPHPVSGKAEAHLPQAKHAIDMLDVLQQKTEGNRTADESAEIEAMLHQLRLTYVQLNK